MQFTKCAALAATLLGSLALGIPAHAQFGSSDNPHDPNDPNGVRSYKSSLELYPISAFTVSASGFSSTLMGGLIAADTRFGGAGGGTSYGIGSWYWFRDNADILEFHGNVNFSQQWGLQAGVLTSTHASGNPYDIFLTYNASAHRGASGRSPFNLRIALGTFVDPVGGTTADFTGFLQGSKHLSARWSLDGSYWYVRDKGADFHRFALGFGYHF